MADPNDFRPFKQLLRWVVRAFYPSKCPPDHSTQASNDDMARSKLGKTDTTGLAIVLMDYLIDHEWVAEEQVVKDLGQHHKILRRALKYLEHEHFLMSHTQRETLRSQKRDMVKAAVTSHTQQLQELQEVQPTAEEEEEEVKKQHTYTYWAVDYPRAFDMIQIRLHIMKKVLKDELDAKDTVARYMCKSAHCHKEYSAYDIKDIMEMDGSLVCSMCGGLVEQVLAGGQTGDEEKRKERKERVKRLQVAMFQELKPIFDLVHSLRNTQPPHWGTIQDWARLQQARKQEASMAHGAGGHEASRGHKVGGVTQLTEASTAAKTKFYQETHVQVTLAPGLEGSQSGAGASGGAAAGGAPSAAAALAGPVVLGSAEAKAPSLQPFFLKRPHAAAVAATNAPHPGQGVATPGVGDVYQQAQYQAPSTFSQQGLSHAPSPEVEQAVKRVKVEDVEVKEEEGAADEDDWEDI